jgi:hypothetical protein
VKGLIKHFGVLAVVIGALAVFPGIASAATCYYDGDPSSSPDPSIVDPAGFSWDLNGYYGEVDDGYNKTTGQDDAFDSYGGMYLSLDGQTFKHYNTPDQDACTLEENGRDINFPDDVTTVPGLALGRSFYVPSAGLAFARYVDSFTNTTDSAKTFTYQWGGSLGSDDNTKIEGSSSGDLLLDASDQWVNTYEDYPNSTDPALTTVWDGGGTPAAQASVAGRWDIAYKDHAPSTDDIGVAYTVSLAPGETKRFMHVTAMRETRTESAAAAAAIAAEPPELFTGLSNAETDTIQNWTVDGDRDGVRNSIDNCPVDSNPGQENLDGDAKGDVCDDDTDGDGLGNATEQALRTDPRKTDTDGDGKNDNLDSCPTIASAADDGCPVPVALPEPADKTAPVASVVVAKKVSLKRLLRRGIVVKLGSNEPASFEVEVAAAAKSARLAQVGDLIVSAKRLAFGAGTRSAKLTIAKKFRNALTPASRLRIRVVATDAAGNRTVKSVRLRLER